MLVTRGNFLRHSPHGALALLAVAAALSLPSTVFAQAANNNTNNTNNNNNNNSKNPRLMMRRRGSISDMFEKSAIKYERGLESTLNLKWEGK